MKDIVCSPSIVSVLVTFNQGTKQIAAIAMGCHFGTGRNCDDKR